ncbi:MAG: DUF4294 domain-containing protein [Odoribacter sp.]|nr:DUF4294 domain-containing protein [Odoribacter sp.]
MVRIICSILLSLFYANALNAQEPLFPVAVSEADTLPHVYLQEVKVKGKNLYKKKYIRSARRQTRLEYNVKKVYPYARIAAEKIQQIDRQIDQTKDKSKRKEIIKKEYKALMKSFKQPLMKLSITQGRILVRLIYRETNNSAFAHIKEYKGSVNAYFWQSLALLFGNNLKADYEPYGKDRKIEDIVKRIERGEL